MNGELKFICKKCQKQMTRMLALIISLPADWRHINKNTIRAKETTLYGADWKNSTIFCPECGAEPEIGNSLNYLIDASVELEQLLQNCPDCVKEIENIKESLAKASNCMKANQK